MQGYNAQAVVDSEAQVIVAAGVTQQANDKQQLIPMLVLAAVMAGRPPEQATADAGYFSEKGVTDSQLEGIDLRVAPHRQKHGEGGPPTGVRQRRRRAWPSGCATS